jgi:UrcA family protein
MFRFIILPLSLAMAAASSPALAASEKLRYGDLDLGTSAGNAVLSARIDNLAQRLCTNPARFDPRTPLRAKKLQVAACSQAVRSDVMIKLAKSQAKNRLAKR